ncbi:hypothetical protein Tco_1415502 [Tanacetum coccineum]
METEEVSDRYIAPCFINGLEAYDGEINIEKKENMISNEFAVKFCLDHEVKCGHKVVKNELIIALRGEIYFVKFIINPEEDDVKPGVVLGSSGENEKIDDDWDLLLDDLDFGDIPEIEGVEIPPFVKPLTQEEAAREELVIDICRRYSIQEEERPVLNNFSAPIYCKALDTTTLRELIDSKGGLIPELPELGLPRVVIPRPPRASMQDLYKRMGCIEIRQGAIKRMAYRQSYH